MTRWRNFDPADARQAGPRQKGNRRAEIAIRRAGRSRANAFRIRGRMKSTVKSQACLAAPGMHGDPCCDRAEIKGRQASGRYSHVTSWSPTCGNTWPAATAVEFRVISRGTGWHVECGYYPRAVGMCVGGGWSRSCLGIWCDYRMCMYVCVCMCVFVVVGVGVCVCMYVPVCVCV